MTTNTVPSLQEAMGLPVIESAGGLVCNSRHHVLLMLMSNQPHPFNISMLLSAISDRRYIIKKAACNWVKARKSLVRAEMFDSDWRCCLF